MAALEAAAKAEGTLTTIALPHDWCNYGEAIETFKTKYGLEVNELDPQRGLRRRDRGDQGQQGQPGPGRRRTSIDVGLAFGPTSKAEGLLENVQGRDLGHDPG